MNAPQLAEERGIDVRETTTTHAHDYVNLISLRGGVHSLAPAEFADEVLAFLAGPVSPAGSDQPPAVAVRPPWDGPGSIAEAA